MFQKGFTITWSDKIYIITGVLTYTIKDDREEITGNFCELLGTYLGMAKTRATRTNLLQIRGRDVIALHFPGGKE